MKRYRHYTKDRAIVLSCFGSIVEQKRYVQLKKIVADEFKECEVFLAFSSRMVLKHLQNSGENFKNLAQVLADVDLLGFRFISVVSVNLFPTDEHEFTKRVVDGFKQFSLANINFSDAILTKTKDTNTFLKSLHRQVSKDECANLYIIHGTPKLDTLGIDSINYTLKFLEFLDERNFTCSLEGAFSYGDIKSQLKNKIKQKGFKNIQIVPMLLVSGSHYKKDMFEICLDLKSDFESSLFSSCDDSFNLLGLKSIQRILLNNTYESLAKMGLKF